MDEAVRVVNQTLGRVWRHKEDFALGVLLDTRYRDPKIRARLSLWLTKHLQFLNRFSTCLGQIDHFFDSRS